MLCRISCFCWLYLIWAYQMSCLVNNVINKKQKTMLISLINANKWLLHVKAKLTVCRLKTASCFVVTDLWVLMRTKLVLVHQSLWSDDQIGKINPFVKLELCLKAYKSSGFWTADFFMFLLIALLKAFL